MRSLKIAYLKTTYEGGTDEGYTSVDGFYDKDKETVLYGFYLDEYEETSWGGKQRKVNPEYKEIMERCHEMIKDGDDWGGDIAWLICDRYHGGFSGAGDGSTYGGTLVLDVEKGTVSRISNWWTASEMETEDESWN